MSARDRLEYIKFCQNLIPGPAGPTGPTGPAGGGSGSGITGPAGPTPPYIGNSHILVLGDLLSITQAVIVGPPPIVVAP